MNLYLISQRVNVDYDTFDAAVVCAPDEAAARTIHPGGYEKTVPEGKDSLDSDYGTWTQQQNVEVKYIGLADDSLTQGVVLASFNAG